MIFVLSFFWNIVFAICSWALRKYIKWLNSNVNEITYCIQLSYLIHLDNVRHILQLLIVRTPRLNLTLQLSDCALVVLFFLFFFRASQNGYTSINTISREHSGVINTVDAKKLYRREKSYPLAINNVIDYLVGGYVCVHAHAALRRLAGEFGWSQNMILGIHCTELINFAMRSDNLIR